LYHNRDENGNTVFHVMAMTGNVKMYHYLIRNYMLDLKNRDVEKIKNNDGRTPLVLAAALAKPEMFQLIIGGQKTVLWTYGPTQNSAYPLDEIDMYDDDDEQGTNPDGPNHPVERSDSLNSLILKVKALRCLESLIYLSGAEGNSIETDVNRADILEKTPMKELVESKWNKFAKYVFMAWLSLYIFYVTIFCLAVLRPFGLENEDGTPTRTLMDLEMVVVFYTICEILIELRDIFTVGSYYVTDKGSRLFHFTVWLKVTFIFLAVFFRMLGMLVAEEICTALASIFVWFFFLYFARGSKTLGIFVVAIREIIIHDIARFFIVYVVVISGFTLSNQVMFRRTSFEGFSTSIRAFLALVKLTFGNDEDFDPNESNNYGFTTISYILFVVLVSLLLLNMLVAMMGDTYNKIAETSAKQYTLEWVSVVVLIERRLPKSIRKTLRIGEKMKGFDENTYYLMNYDAVEWGKMAAIKQFQYTFQKVVKRVLFGLRFRIVPQKKGPNPLLGNKEVESGLATSYVKKSDGTFEINIDLFRVEESKWAPIKAVACNQHTFTVKGNHISIQEIKTERETLRLVDQFVKLEQ